MDHLSVGLIVVDHFLRFAWVDHEALVAGKLAVKHDWWFLVAPQHSGNTHVGLVRQRRIDMSAVAVSQFVFLCCGATTGFADFLGPWGWVDLVPEPSPGRQEPD